MTPRARQLLELLSRDTTNQILDELKRAARTNGELEDATAVGRLQVTQTLDLLLAHGLVTYSVERGGKPGRPARRWELSAARSLEVLERQVMEFLRSAAR